MNKNIYDPIHGYVSIDPLALKIIDTVEFQRLRNIKQLGVLNYVYPSANHTRFEHSIGVYHLAGKFIETLKKNQPELIITDRDIQNIKIAGLCHDLGHGPFSHLFDKFLELNYVESEYTKHEYRSKLILRFINDKYSLEINDEDLLIIGNMILPTKNTNSDYKYQIVSNSITGIDVDKFDYIIRDSFYLGLKYNCDYERVFECSRIINNQICFNEKIIFNLYDIYYNRAKLHNQVYSHSVGRSIELMILDLLKISSVYKQEFIKSINSPEIFCKYDDNIIWLIKKFENEFDTGIVSNIETRILYKLIHEAKIQNIDLYKIQRYIKKKKKYNY